MKDYAKGQVVRVSLQKGVLFLLLTAACLYPLVTLFLLPTISHQEDKFVSSPVIGAVFWSVLSLLFLILLVMAVIPLFNYKLCGDYKKLAKAGVSPEEVNQIVSHEIAEGPIAATKKIIVLKTYIVWNYLYRFTVYKKDDLVWAYSITTVKTVNGLAQSKFYMLYLWFANGKSFTQRTKSAVVCADMLEKIAATCPYAYNGYSDDLSKLFRGNRAEFLRQIEERKKITLAEEASSLSHT